MATLTYSNTLSDHRFSALNSPPAREAPLSPDRYYSIDLKRSLARWENEGGALDDETNPLRRQSGAPTQQRLQQT